MSLTALAVDKSGALNVIWVEGNGPWQGPNPISASNLFIPDKETHIAMCKQTDDRLTALASADFGG